MIKYSYRALKSSCKVTIVTAQFGVELKKEASTIQVKTSKNTPAHSKPCQQNLNNLLVSILEFRCLLFIFSR